MAEAIKTKNLTSDAVFSVKNLHFKIGDKAILSDVTFDIPKGQIGVVIGESGVGKSTLLKLLSGLVKASSGEILFLGEKLSGPENMIPGNPQITRIAQDFELMPHVSAVENIHQGAMHLLDEEKAVLGEKLLKMLGLKKVQHQITKTLSGGEQQRIAMAKAMAANKNVLLFDEVFSQLDLGTKAAILIRLKRHIKQKNRTALFVLHDPQDAFYLADFVLVLQGGKLVQSGSLHTVVNHSASSKVAALFGLVNKMSLQRAKELFPEKWQRFNRKNQKVWFRPDAARVKDLAAEFSVLDSFFNGANTLELIKIGRTEIWLQA